MCIARKITKAMIHFDGIPITCLPSGLHHNTITGGIHRRARTSRKVHPRMKLGCLINRIYTDTVTGSRLLQILIGNRLDGRNTFQHLVMALTQIHHLVKRLGLDIKLPVQHIQLLSGIDNQIGIRHIPQLFIAVCPPITGLTDCIRYRIGLQHHPIQIIITLLDILHHPHSLIQTMRQHIILGQ